MSSHIQLLFEAPLTCEAMTPRVLGYTTQDVIDPRISVPAQHALVRLSKKPTTSAKAVGLLEAVKTGKLAGIYKADEGPPARRAQRLDKRLSWGSLIPKGQGSALILDPENVLRGQPMIVFYPGLAPTPQAKALDAALMRGWQDYLTFRSESTSASLCCMNLGNPEVLDRFEFDKDTVLPFHQLQIARISRCIVSREQSPQPVRFVQLVGHTDPVGTGQYNLHLGLRRAKQVERHLRQAIESQHPGLTKAIAFDVQSLGESRPTGKGAESDRRVEITLAAQKHRKTPCCPCPPIKSRDFTAWLQRSLNQILGLRLPVNGIFDVQTQQLLRKFQVTARLPVTGTFDHRTYQRIKFSGATAPPCIPMDAFPGRYTAAIQNNATLTSKLHTAITTHPALKQQPEIAFTIVQLGQGGTPHQWAGYNETREHFSASLIKVAAIYAAHELRAAVNRLARDPNFMPKTEQELFAVLETCFTQQIIDNFSHIRARAKKCCKTTEECKRQKEVGNEHLRPKYREIFDVRQSPGATSLQVNFKPRFETELTRIVGNPSPLGHAGYCIHCLGYAYIAGALEKAGFLNTSSMKGIWLCGDYLRQWPYLCVDSDNDKLVAQATTTYDMAMLYTLLYQQRLFADPAYPSSSAEMLARLASGRRYSWIGKERMASVPYVPNYDVTHSKIGEASLKQPPRGKGGDVYSEGCILQSQAKTYVVVWQNYRLRKGEYSARAMKVIAEVVEKTIL